MPRISDQLRQDRRDAIVQAAVDCLARYGYNGTSMRTIAQAVGLTKGGLYPYFPNKDAILLAVADRYLVRNVERLAPQPGVRADEQLFEYMHEFAATFHDPMNESRRRAVLDLWLAAGDNPAVRNSIEHRFEAFLQALTELIRRGQEEGVFRGELVPKHAAGLVLAARDGMLFETLKLNVGVPIDSLNVLLGTLFLVPPEPGEPAAGRPWMHAAVQVAHSH